MPGGAWWFVIAKRSVVGWTRNTRRGFSLGFIKLGHNAVPVGPNGIAKTMILNNVAQHALSRGHTVRFTRSCSFTPLRMTRWSSPPRRHHPC